MLVEGMNQFSVRVSLLSLKEIFLGRALPMQIRNLKLLNKIELNRYSIVGEFNEKNGMPVVNCQISSYENPDLSVITSDVYVTPVKAISEVIN